MTFEREQDDQAQAELEEERYYQDMELIEEISEKAGAELALRVAECFGLGDDFVQEHYGFKPVSITERIFDEIH